VIAAGHYEVEGRGGAAFHERRSSCGPLLLTRGRAGEGSEWGVTDSDEEQGTRVRRHLGRGVGALQRAYHLTASGWDDVCAQRDER